MCCCITCATYHYAYYVHANISTVLRRLQANLKALREAQKVAVDAKRKALELIQGESISWAVFFDDGHFYPLERFRLGSLTQKYHNPGGALSSWVRARFKVYT